MNSAATPSTMQTSPSPPVPQPVSARECFDGICKTPGFLRSLQGAVGGERVPAETARQIVACLLEFCIVNPKYRRDECIVAVLTFLKFNKASSGPEFEAPSAEMVALDTLLTACSLEDGEVMHGVSGKEECEEDADTWGAEASLLSTPTGRRRGEGDNSKQEEEEEEDVPDCWEDSDADEEACVDGIGAGEAMAAACFVEHQPVSLEEIWQVGGAPGGRHDNDHVGFRSISVCPTADEVNSLDPPALPSVQLPGEDGLLERHFRLLREDMVSSLRESIKGSPRDPSLIFQEPEFVGVRVLPRPCIVLRVQACAA